MLKTSPLADVSFNGVAIVAAVALGAPLALGLFPKLLLPAIVLEIVLGIAIGPQVLGWVSIDTPIQVLSLLGLAALGASGWLGGKLAYHYGVRVADEMTQSEGFR